MATIPLELVRKYYKEDDPKFDNLQSAKEVLDHPMMLFAGVRRFNEGGWCFVGHPRQHFIRRRVSAPMPPGRVFAVYLNPSLFLYEWRLEYVEDGHAPCPRDYRDRFERLVWKSTS